MKKISSILKSIITTTLILVGLFLFVYNTDYASFFSVSESSFNYGWTQIIDGEEIPLTGKVQNAVLVDVGETAVYQNELPYFTVDSRFFFYSIDQEVAIYVDGEKMYSYMEGDQEYFLEKSTSIWHSVLINPEMSGKTITVEITSHFHGASGFMYNTYLSDDADFSVVVLKTYALSLLLGLISVIIGFMVLITTNRWERAYTGNKTQTIGVLYILNGLYLMVASGGLNSLIDNPPLLLYLTMIVFRLLPIQFINLAEGRMAKPNKIFAVIKSLLWINLVVSFILIPFGISLLEQVHFAHVMLVIFSLICIGVMLYEALRYKKDIMHTVLFCLPVVFFIGMTIDALFFLFNKFTLIGTASCTAFFVYTFVGIHIYIKLGIKAEIQKQELKKELEKTKLNMLFKQIKAHFLYNTLNTISALCKKDAKEADRAVILFSSYMRINMYLIEHEEPIPFLKELELINAYTSIQKIRFGDRVDLHMDINFTQFNIPSLSIQPIVENAFSHGIGKKAEGGTVGIKTVKKENIVEIIISDTGEGFDLKKLDNPEAMGIKNISSRINLLVGGKVKIQSEIGVGTTVTVTIPLDDHDIVTGLGGIECHEDNMC